MLTVVAIWAIGAISVLIWLLLAVGRGSPLVLEALILLALWAD